MPNINYQNIKKKRVSLLIGTWNFLSENGQIDGKKFTLSMPLLEEVVEHYIEDLKALKGRYKIPKYVQLHKVAGLTTASILRYRPIVPITIAYEEISDIYVNEVFAVIHGLAICGEYSLDECEEISRAPWFRRWLDDLLHLLHRRNHTPESLAFIYQTLSTFVFPKNIEILETDSEIVDG